VLRNSSIVKIQERNLELQLLPGVSSYLCLCRSTLAVFSTSLFLGQNVQRKLVLMEGEGAVELQVRNMTANEYKLKFLMASRANSRGQSPKKRQRSVQGNEDDNGSGRKSEDYHFYQVQFAQIIYVPNPSIFSTIYTSIGQNSAT
jgi:hypothetical protein